MKLKQKLIIEQKTIEFCKEVDHLILTEENKRIYNAFVYRRAKPYKFEIIDKYDNTIRFVLCTNKLDDGVLHIMLKHYRGAVGNVNAYEILNFCDVIRDGEINANDNSITYGDFYKLLFERFMNLSLRRFLFFSKEHSELCD